MVEAGGAEEGVRRSGPEFSLLQGQLEELGLSPSEARVLVALLRVGSATAPELSRLSGVPRTNTYPVVESLSRRHLATRIPGKGPVIWAAPPRDEVIPYLEAALVASQEERLQQHRMRAAQASEVISSLLSDAPTVNHSYVHILRGPTQAKRVYDQMVSEAQELLVCNRPPYTHDRRFPNPIVLEEMQRGLKARALYQAAQWNDPAAEPFRRASGAYHEAGVQWRLAESLPIKMAVADQRVAIVSLNDTDRPDGELEVTVLIEHPEYAAVHASIFEALWADAQPGEIDLAPDEQMLGDNVAG